MIGRPLPYHIRTLFPNLTNHNHRITSLETDNYNCIAWAYKVSDKRMWPGNPDYYWPSEVTGPDELATLVQLYLNEGYEKCGDGEQEEGYEKVAIYVNQEGPQHAALQLDCGLWTSKLGNLQDIEHDTIEGLEGAVYGRAIVFLKKHRT